MVLLLIRFKTVLESSIAHDWYIMPNIVVIQHHHHQSRRPPLTTNGLGQRRRYLQIAVEPMRVMIMKAIMMLIATIIAMMMMMILIPICKPKMKPCSDTSLQGIMDTVLPSMWTVLERVLAMLQQKGSPMELFSYCRRGWRRREGRSQRRRDA
jgi:hypothetical protein